MHKYTIVVFWSEEYQKYIAHCPGIDKFEFLTGVNKDMGKAIEEINESIEMELEIIKEENQEIPQPNLRDYKEIRTVFENQTKPTKLKVRRDFARKIETKNKKVPSNKNNPHPIKK